MDTKTLNGSRVENGRNELLDAREDAKIMELYHLVKENRKPLPRRGYYNNATPQDGNMTIRFDGLPLYANTQYLLRLIPPALSNYVSVDHPDFLSLDSNCKYGFVNFDCHNMAKHFLDSFNGKSYRGITYRLSWAQFPRFVVEETNDDFAKWYVPHTDSDIDSDSDSYSDTSSEYYEEDEYIDVMKVEETPFEEFYIYLDKEFHDDQDSWRFAEFEPPTVESYWKFSGPCSIIYLFRVDPVVKKSHMQGIFEKYGKCVVDLPDGKCYGHVEFEEKECAEEAFKTLYYLMTKLQVCILRWGVRGRKVNEAGLTYMDFDCPVFGKKCLHSRKKAQALRLLRNDDHMISAFPSAISWRPSPIGLETAQKTEDVKGKMASLFKKLGIWQ